MRLAILGTGNIGGALLTGLLRSGTVAAGDVVCTARSEARRAEVAETHGVATTGDNREAVAAAEVVLLAVKPDQVAGVLREVAGELDEHHTIVSVAAGVDTATIEGLLEDPVPVVRVMTNTPVRVDTAMSALAPGAHAGADALGMAERLLAPVGRTRRVDESQMNAVTALSGSGPAYVFLLAEALIDAGVQEGLDRDTAAELVVQTIAGAARLLAESDADAAALRQAVSSPGGTTVAALRELEAAGLRTAVADAVAAARRRGDELASG